MSVALVDWDDLQAVQVFRTLDPHDHMEAELLRGRLQTGYGLFADWRAVRPHHVVSLIAVRPGSASATPFAVLCLANTGQAGVGEAALLARSHSTFRRQLAELGLLLRANFPGFAREHGIHRIEARCWADHPTAPGFLEACGFHREAEMNGFGGHGKATFHQYAWTAEQ